MTDTDRAAIQRQLHARLIRLRLDAQAEFERLIAHVDDRDPDQVALVQPQIDALFAKLKEDVAAAITSILVRELAIKPALKMIGIDLPAPDDERAP